MPALRTMAANSRTTSATRSVQVARHLLHGLRADGLDAPAIIEAARAHEGARLDERVLRELDLASVPAQVPAAAIWALWESALAASGDGLVTAWRYGAQAISAPEAQTLRLAATTCATLGAALETFVRYSAMAAQAYDITLSGEDRERVLRIAGAPERLGAVADALYLASAIVRCALQMSERDARSGIRIALPWSVPDAGLVAACGIALDWGADALCMTFSPELWSAPARSYDAALHRRLERELVRELELMRPTMTSRVRAAIATCASMHQSAESIARRCGVSPRTMRRALLDEGLAFRVLLDDWRRAQASAWLHRESDGELAARLGFADARTFRRAFQAWTGTTPARARLMR